MWIVRLALHRPYTFLVLALLILIFGVTSIETMPTDVFPSIDIPVISVLWQYTGITPDDIWREMERREDMLGIAEKLPKSAVKMSKVSTPRVARRPIVALESRNLRKRH